MRATLTRYSVPGWGDGELWTLGEVVLAHDFSYLDERATRGVEDDAAWLSARPLEGVVSPPTGTVLRKPSRVADVSVPSLHQRSRASHRSNGSHAGPVASDLVERLAAFLSGADVGFGDVELDLTWATPFQRAAAGALRGIPRGEVVTYGELAALAGYPGAARAVGSFCAQNRFALLVPCHRVVGAAGIGGYGASGPAVKRRLLALEGTTA